MPASQTMTESPDRRRAVVDGIMLGARVLVGATLLYAGLQKIQAPFAFFESVLSYRVASAPWSLVAAVVIPWLEVVLGVLLIGGAARGAALLLAAALLLSFVGAQIAVMVENRSVACGCFALSGDSTMVGWTTLTRAGLLLGICLLALVVYHVSPARQAGTT